MMKKFVVMCLMVMAVGLFAGDFVIPGWRTSNWTEEKINEGLKNERNAVKFWAKMMQEAKENPKIFQDYDLFMTTAKNISKELGIKEDYGYHLAATIVIWNNYDFSDDFITRMYVENTGKNTQLGKTVDMAFTIKAKNIKGFNYQKYVENYLNFDNLTFHQCDVAFNFLKNNQFKFSDEDLKADLKKLNRMVYPNISKDDNWKQLAVQIQLMLKSLE